MSLCLFYQDVSSDMHYGLLYLSDLRPFYALTGQSGYISSLLVKGNTVVLTVFLYLHMVRNCDVEE